MKKISEFIATGFYVGHLPTAPGTFGSFAAVLIAFWLNELFDLDIFLKTGIMIIIAIIGWISANNIMKDIKNKDPQYIVIDEWAGQFTTLLFVPWNIENLLAGFILFRIFDIWKVFPIKNAEKLKGAWGVMADDILAGFYAAPLLLIWDKLI